MAFHQYTSAKLMSANRPLPTSTCSECPSSDWPSSRVSARGRGNDKYCETCSHGFNASTLVRVERSGGRARTRFVLVPARLYRACKYAEGGRTSPPTLYDVPQLHSQCDPRRGYLRQSVSRHAVHTSHATLMSRVLSDMIHGDSRLHTRKTRGEAPTSGSRRRVEWCLTG